MTSPRRINFQTYNGLLQLKASTQPSSRKGQRLNTIGHNSSSSSSSSNVPMVLSAAKKSESGDQSRLWFFSKLKQHSIQTFFPIRPFPIFNWFDRSKISVVTKVFFHSVIFFPADAGRSVFVAWSEKPNHAISFNSDLSYKRANIRY